MIDTNGKTILEHLDVFIFTPPPLAIWFLMASATLLTSFTHFVLLQICKIEECAVRIRPLVSRVELRTVLIFLHGTPGLRRTTEFCRTIRLPGGRQRHSSRHTARCLSAAAKFQLRAHPHDYEDAEYPSTSQAARCRVTSTASAPFLDLQQRG